ncbi:uncharacterized protein LOC142331744 [Lycorma delicatula]|uniref:uncharacterized protein LOC142331744 n=1 Tax=Lycorma delicatula TaxID=130591 RepID=UPI003F5166FD
MLIWTTIIFILFTIALSSNHPLQDDSDPEIVEARRTQVLSGSTHPHHYDNTEDETTTEEGRISRGKSRNKYTQRVISDRKDSIEKTKDEVEGENKSEEINKSRSKSDRSRSKPDENDETENASKTSNVSSESKSNKTVNEVKDTKDETINEASPQKTGNDSHKNYTRLDSIRGRKSSPLSSSFRRQRTPSHVQTETTSETPDNLSESVINNTSTNSKKRRRLQTTTTTTTVTPQTMPYNLYNHFRPLDQDVPQDHLLPFLDFGKKLSPGIPPTPSGLNSIENKSNSHNRHKPKEHVTTEYRSTKLDEDIELHEDMDVTVVKKTIERNNVPRGKIQLRDPYISGYYRRRPTTQQTLPTTTAKNFENLIITPTTECLLSKENGSDELKANRNKNASLPISYKHNSRTVINNTKCEVIDDNTSVKQKPTPNDHISNEKTIKNNTAIILLNRTLNNRKNNNNNKNNTEKIVDFENIKHYNSNNTSRTQKFERIKVEPLSETTILRSTTKRTLLPITLNVRNKINNNNNSNNNNNNNTSNETSNKKENEQQKNVDPLIHEESNRYERNLTHPIITTISPTNQQLTTRILSTAVVTSVSVKESLPKNNSNSKINETLSNADLLINITNNSTMKDNDSKYSKVDVKTVMNENLNTKMSNNKSLIVNDNNEKNLGKTDEFHDSTSSSSSPKIIFKPTTSTLTNKSIPDDFIDVPRISIKNQRITTTTIKPITESNKKEFNKTLITNASYKPKITLPRTNEIISTTVASTTKTSTTPRIIISKILTTRKTILNNDEKTIVKNKVPVPVIELTPNNNPIKTNTNDTKEMPSVNNNNNNTELGFEITPTIAKISTTEININKDKDNNNNNPQTSIDDMDYENASSPSPSNNFNSTSSAIETDNTRYEQTNTSKENREELNYKSFTNSDINIEINTPAIETDQQNQENIEEEKDQLKEVIVENNDKDLLTEIPDKVEIDRVKITNTYRDNNNKIIPPTTLTSLSTSALDHKWLHSTGSRLNSNVSITDSNEDVGVAYPEGVHIATYILTGLGIIPILLLAVIVARMVVIRNRKKVLDESEYSSEYNRSPLGATNSPLPTKLPRVPAHLGWEVEKTPLPPIPVTSTRWEFPRDKLRLQTVLGQGNFGQVWKAEADDISGHEGLTRLVAVKTVKEGASNREREDLLRELGIMQELGAHPNVVTLLGCCTEKEPYLLIMEYVMYGKLLAFLRDHRTRAHYYNFSESTDALTSRDLTVFAYCVARGMDYLTTKGIIHRDLAARNVLVDHNKLCKIADFGMSRNVRDTGQIYEQRQSKGALPIRWMAPESLHFSLFTHKTDVWSFGILMWEIVTLGSTPYANMGAREVMRRVREGYRLDRPSHCHQEFFRVIQRCWNSEPAKRPTFAELKHELGQLLGDSEHGGGYVDLDGLAEEIKHHNSSGASTLQRPHNH